MTTLQEIFNDNLVIPLDKAKQDRQLMRQIQTRLRDLGLLQTNQITGSWGLATEAALIRFCQVTFLDNMTTGMLGRTFAKKLIEMPGPLTGSASKRPATLKLKSNVGRRGDNMPNDIATVKNRLADLGFMVSRNSAMDLQTEHAIRLFQSIIQGASILAGDGRVDVGGPTHQFLEATNAPMWQEMPNGSSDEGFLNFDRVQPDNHDWGVDWLIETVKAAGQLYRTSHLISNPHAALLNTNNLSLPKGGDTPFHHTHETGLSCDVLLPRTDGLAGLSDFRHPLYDRSAMRGILRAIQHQKHSTVKHIFFNDPALIEEGLCVPVTGHHNHAHFDIHPPKPVLK